MAENPLFTRLLQQLAATDDPAAKAAIIAELAFDQLPPPVATVARRCIILRWFDESIVAALLPEATTDQRVLTAAEVAIRLFELPFVEQLAGERYAYHDQTRSGLLARYGVEQPELLKKAATLAAPTYQAHADQPLAESEVLFCLIVAGQQAEASQQLDHLIDGLRSREDWNGLLGLFNTCNQANSLPYVAPLQHTAYHYYSGGVALRQLGKFDEAISAYQQAITVDEKYARSWNGLSVVYHDRKEYDAAIIACRQAIKLDNKYASPWNCLGNVYLDLKQYKAAIDAYQQAIALDETYTYPWNNLGLVYYALRQYEKAIAAFQQAIALDEKYARPWSELGFVYHRLKRYREAVTAYQKAITLNEKYARPWRGLGRVYYVLKNYKEAIAAYQNAITLDEKDVYAWNGIGLVYRRLKQYEEAIAAFRQAIAVDEKFNTPYQNLGSTLRFLERWAEAEGTIRQAQTLNSQDWTDWFVLADILRHRGDMQAWQDALDQARPLVDYTDLYNAACFESVAGNVDRALELLTQAAAQGQLDPEWASEDPDLHWIRHDPRFWQVIGWEPAT